MITPSRSSVVAASEYLDVRYPTTKGVFFWLARYFLEVIYLTPMDLCAAEVDKREYNPVVGLGSPV
jgi:hypothetical protein